MEKVANQNFYSWNSALQTKNAQEVADLYSEKCTFLPTLLGKFLIGKDKAKGYFEHFLLKNPFGEIIEEEVQAINPNCYVHSGLYDFEVDGDGGRRIVNARFTFIWENIDGDWKIIHHHSSVKPE